MHFVGDVFVLHGFEQGGETPERFLVGVGGVLFHQVWTRTVERFAVLRDRVREIPHHGTGLGITKWVATMVLHEDANHAARVIGLPVFAFGQRLFSIGEFVPPTELFEQDVVEFWIARGDVGTQRVGAVFCQQVFAFTLYAEIGAEVTAAFHDVFGGVIQIR